MIKSFIPLRNSGSFCHSFSLIQNFSSVFGFMKIKCLAKYLKLSLVPLFIIFLSIAASASVQQKPVDDETHRRQRRHTVLPSYATMSIQGKAINRTSGALLTAGNNSGGILT